MRFAADASVAPSQAPTPQSRPHFAWILRKRPSYLDPRNARKAGNARKMLRLGSACGRLTRGLAPESSKIDNVNRYKRGHDGGETSGKHIANVMSCYTLSCLYFCQDGSFYRGGFSAASGPVLGDNDHSISARLPYR